MKVLIDISARHCHLSQSDSEALFGVGYKLMKRNDLLVFGTFAAEETVVFKAGNGRIDNLRVVGPFREETQVELSASDARKLGISPSVRISGDLENTPGGELIGPVGKINLVCGVIISKRHLHCDPSLIKKLNLKNGNLVSVKVEGERSLTFHDVVLRSCKNSEMIMHIDVDEANAALISGENNFGILIK